MKKVLAFVIALVMAGGTILGMHVWASGRDHFDSADFAYWTAEQKFRSLEVIRDNLNENSLVVLASSELQHGQDTPYHPKNMFKDNSFQTMLIGAGHYQSLSHAITLAAIEPAMKNRKVVLLVSPQWFRPKGIGSKAFASRFSESSFIDMLQNEKLSDATKQQITDRAVSLLRDDKPMQKRVVSYKELLLDHKKNHVNAVKFQLYKSFLNDKQKQSMLMLAAVEGIGKAKERILTSGEPDWSTYLADAEQDAKKKTSNNQFQISNKYYNWKVKPQLGKRKGSSSASSYLESPEYDDLKCFLNVCRDLEIEPMVVLLPVNGKWYDYTKFPKDKLAQFYQKAGMTAHEYGAAKVVDLSEDSDKDYYLEDTIHIGWKGWVTVNEAIYQFGRQDQGTPEN